MKKNIYLLLVLISLNLVSCGGNQKHEGHDYVDLGLSVKWATCNVGANNPKEVGDYFAWGEVVPKARYNWDTYKFFDRNMEFLTKYCTRDDYGPIDDKSCLDSKDDAANLSWGGKWRMPTSSEIEELIGKCTWEGTSLDGIEGSKVTGPNGNSIFLPFSGSIDNGDDLGYKEFGWYWSSSLKEDEPFAAWIVVFADVKKGLLTPARRTSGCQIRPVLSK